MSLKNNNHISVWICDKDGTIGLRNFIHKTDSPIFTFSPFTHLIGFAASDRPIIFSGHFS